MSSRKPPAGPPPAPEPLATPLVDAHTHLDAMAQRAGVPADAAFVAAAMAQAAAAGVGAAVTVGGTMADSRWAVEASHAHADVWSAVAVHPTEVGELAGADVDDRYAELEVLARDPRCVAVGETGLDYYWDRTDPVDQLRHFRRHIELAHTVGKPLMIHDREAHDDVLRTVQEVGVPAAGVVMHSFSGDVRFAASCLDAGFVLSFSGVATFTNAAALRSAVTHTPLGSILVETDAPFLTPHPWRGRPNAPYLLGWTLRGVASLLDLDPDVVAAATTATAARIYPGLGVLRKVRADIDG